ncbi:MAG: Uma2 family endonuclease [Gemmataceae bacterium]|nr:Uma2 family endonuclease [Gemmataceae bacterium]
MAAVSAKTRETHYPDSDGKPVGETPIHILNLRYVTEPLEQWFADDPRTLVAGDMFVYHEEGNPRKHVSPDVFVSRDVAVKDHRQRRKYLLWEEGKPPDLVIELTSKSTRHEDLVTKFQIYQDVLGVREYFLFDPFGEYLQPRLQGYRLQKGKYVAIRPVKGRLPSKVLGLHLEADGEMLRFYDPEKRRRLPIPPEDRQALRESRAARRRAEAAQQREEAARQRAEAETERLRREVEELRRRLS